MGAVLEVIGGYATNPSTTLTAITLATGDSLSVRAFNPQTKAYVLNTWAQGATAGTVRLRSPRMHDNVQNLRLNYPAAAPVPLFGRQINQLVYPLDVLTAEISGGGSETDALALLLYYEDLAGSNARLATWEQIKPRIVNILTVETQHTTGGTAGTWGGSLAINANFDLLKAGKDYALLGYLASASVTAVGYKGPDTGNFRLGGPGIAATRIETRDWFVRLSNDEGIPAIPIINAANRFGTFVDLLSTAASAAVTVDSVVAELAS